MAGDPNLATSQATEAAAATDQGHEPAELAVWLAWFARARWIVPFGLLPGWYAVHRLLGFEFHPVPVAVVIFLSLLVNAIGARVLTSYRHDLARNARKLERLASVQTLVDILLLVSVVHVSGGGAMGPFWPFPFIPVLIGAALLPSLRSVLFHSAFAITTTAVSAWSRGAAEVLAPIVLATMFVSTGSLLAHWLARGLSDQRRTNRGIDRLRADKELAEAVARRREEILAVVSHELASPLMTLRGYVRLLKESKGRERNPTELLDRVERQVERLTNLADDLLEMASSSAGALHLHRAHFELVEALGEMRDGLLLQFPEAEITLVGETSVTGAWDRDRLEQLFGNLISNAVKFGGARCHIEIDVQREGAREVHVHISDDGPGISALALTRIFEPFQRYSTERGGLGLGLAIARAVVELHEGRIWAQSPSRKGDRGATFHVVLPTDSDPSGELPVTAIGRSRRTQVTAAT